MVVHVKVDPDVKLQLKTKKLKVRETCKVLPEVCPDPLNWIRIELLKELKAEGVSSSGFIHVVHIFRKVPVLIE